MSDAVAMIAACMRHQPEWLVARERDRLCNTCGEALHGSAIVIEQMGLAWHGGCFTREELYRQP